MKYILLSVFVLLTSCTSTPLVLPGPILALDDKAETREAIVDGMAKRVWVIDDETDDKILARLNIRSHMAKVWIEYPGRTIVFSYAGSANLDCKPQGNACRSIHRKYNGWVNNLSMDIGAEINKRK